MLKIGGLFWFQRFGVGGIAIGTIFVIGYDLIARLPTTWADENC